MKINIGVIPAAGKGTRAYPRTDYIPKTLFMIEGKSILQKNIDILVSIFEVKIIYILVGYLKEQVIAEINKIKDQYSISIQTQLWTQKGLANDIASLEKWIQEPFITILGDEFYQKSNHKQLLITLQKYPKLKACIAITKTFFTSYIKKNYSVEIKEERVLHLIEKPKNPINNILGLGSYIFTTAYFEFFKKTEKSKNSNIVEITDVIDKMAQETKEVFASDIDADYININSMQDYHFANYQIKSEKFNTFKKTLILISSQELNITKEIIANFEPLVDEILIYSEKLQNLSMFSNKIAVYQKKLSQGITNQIIKETVQKSTGDILIFVSSEGCFRSKDLPKFLEYMKDSDMVIGTRTTRQMIEQGSNLNGFDRLSNLILGKLIEIFWWKLETRLTDANCFYFTIWKDAYKKIENKLNSSNKEFIAEIMIETIRAYLRCIEIPVSFYKSILEKKISFTQTSKNFFQIIKLIFQKKFFQKD